MPNLTKNSAQLGLSLIAASWLISCSTAVQADPSDPNTPKWHATIDRFAQKEIKRSGVPSIQIAIGHRGEVVFNKAYGLADVDAQIAATPRTLYRTASISKWLTGVATMILVDAGKLDLDAPIQTYCPAYPKKETVMTTRHLLTHSAGIRHYKRGESDPPSVIHYDDVIGPLETFKDDDLLFQPGMGHAYSSHGYRVLGCVIVGASTVSYNAYMDGAIFSPLGMTDTQMDDATRSIPNKAVGYDFTARRKVELAPERDVSENLPAGGHLSTASDLIRFSQAFDQDDLISQEMRALMTSLPIAKTGQMIPAGYGHGVDFLSAFPGAIGHGGRQEGATTQLVLWEDDDISIAIMANARGWRGIDKLTSRIFKAIEPSLDE